MKKAALTVIKNQQIQKANKKLTRKRFFANFFSDEQFSRRFCIKFFPSDEDSEICDGCSYRQDQHIKVTRFFILRLL